MNEATVRALIRRFAEAGGIPDGDKGDITTSGGGTTWTIDAGAVALATLATDVTDYIRDRGRTLLATRTASASATLDFTEFNNAVYRRYEFELENLLPATDAVGLVMRFSTDGGATYDATAGNYSHARTQKILATAEDDTGGSGSATNIVLATNIGTAAGEQGVTGILRLWSAGSAVRTTARWELHTFDAGAGGINMISGVGARLANQDTDAVRFLQGADNIASGTIRMFGIV